MRHRRKDSTHKPFTGPLRRVIDTDESGFYVKFLLECGHISLMYPYKFKDHPPYPKRRRCFTRCGLEEALPCKRCSGRGIVKKDIFWDHARGGIVCPRCQGTRVEKP